MIDLPETVRAIIFDCDGTLTDSMPVHHLAWQSTLAEHGIPFGEERFYAMAGMPSDRIISVMSAEHGKDLDAKTLAVEKEQNFLKFLHRVRPVEKVVEFARRQQGRRKMAVASGGFRWVIDEQIEHVGLTGHFDAVVTAEDTQRHKPFPDVFLEAARRMGVEPGECVVFEDADLGVEAANRAGMAVVDVRRGGWGSSSV